jgi:hypothetical protein
MSSKGWGGTGQEWVVGGGLNLCLILCPKMHETKENSITSIGMFMEI